MLPFIFTLPYGKAKKERGRLHLGQSFLHTTVRKEGKV
ncbi:hypothetical protein TGS27_1034 [Geobacillus stearothermophilus]|uniref:Uncharacterized protein n=1 Tax=Geobacillus stearothermophilus TaxID=1422 RepID=A0A150M2M4_GEOSE|nr:hypothetical protein GS8_1552 [Geobacillus stearothermophilus]KYD18844.1 hypothetical protein B4109_0688 [Geobacillus stearothermophilus]KYD32313.1 hypothetical protein B4114_0727 [Geobacillus stearothermophilus]OAO83545.1 hypothetical protein TGS27_1034 [Geobacillus stearothermophilus]